MSPTLPASRVATRLCAAMTLASAASLSAQTIWDGNGDANASGAWNTDLNWSTNTVPSAVAVQLNDVTSGTRTVTLDTSGASITSLSINQSTAGATNALSISGVTLTITTGTNGYNQTLTGGAINVSANNGGQILLSSGAAKTSTNAGTLTLGDSTTNGSFLANNGASTSKWDWTLANSGTITLNRQSSLGISTTSGNGRFTLNNTGTANFNGDATGLRIGLIAANTNSTDMNPVINNTGEINVGVLEGSASGLTRFGTLVTDARARGATFNNNSGGVMNVAANATFRVVGRRLTDTANDFRLDVTNNTGAIINLGSSASTTGGGTIDYTYSLRSTPTTPNFPALIHFTNAGTANLYGTSTVRINSGSTLNADGGSITVNNSGDLNLHDTSSIGSTGTTGSGGRNTFFTNSGTLTKLRAGTANIYSQTGGTGTATNTGTIHVKDGQLAFTSALDSSAATATLKFDLANADISTALLNTPAGLSLGTDSGSALNLVFTAALSGDHTYNLWDGAATGQFTSVALSGFGFSGTYGGSPTAWSSNGYSFSLDYGTGVLSLTAVPEPSAFAALAGLGALGFVASRRRRRG